MLQDYKLASLVFHIRQGPHGTLVFTFLATISTTHTPLGASCRQNCHQIFPS